MKLHFTNVNTNKLHDELIAAGVAPQLVESKDGDTWITVDDSQEAAVNAVVAAHNPSILPDVQAAKIAEIETAYDNALSAGFTSSATGTPLEYDYRPSDRADFQKFTLTVALGVATFPVPIGLKDNSVVNHTQEQYLQLLRDIQALEWSLKERKRQLVAQVLAATTVEQVNAISWA
jgi:hypothetical protein